MGFQIDEELRDLFPPLTEEEYQLLEKNILRDGCTSAIYIWNGYIVDGHNRYKICTEHGIPYRDLELEYETKEEVIQWMVDTQLGRRNLTPIQKIGIAEKYRPIYEKQAKENMSLGGGDQKSGSVILPKPIKKVNTREELAKLAGVSGRTYDKGKQILDLEKAEDLSQKDKDIIEKVKSGEKKINTAHKELFKSDSELQDIELKGQGSEKEEEKKICSKCGESKSLLEFYDGRAECIDCHNKPVEKKVDIFKGVDMYALEADIKNPNKSVDSDSILMEIEFNTNEFIQIMNKYIGMENLYKDISKENKIKVLETIENVEDVINKIKNILI